jgi:hypothetical protein
MCSNPWIGMAGGNEARRYGVPKKGRKPTKSHKKGNGGSMCTQLEGSAGGYFKS